ncbi:MAG: phosphate signaling complex protein PhoU [Clostridia bacterium]|jgi:phosphate transport system protein|nr:phosphate signaling complex protein PhoU [Clostridia bacterium]MCI2001225.1 phosphate signaling complex protein PhoU [Clostridia bacterium]MCI2015907.1 phosphate signaling complex protein PhoU [Clostridia bacterium]
MRETFIHEIEDLNDDLIMMGSMIESAISKAVEALTNKDVDLAQEAIEFDNQIDNKEKEIESRCIALLVQQQPVASDLRLVTAAIKMITDMERIGDHAADISEIMLIIADSDYTSHMSKIPEIAKATIKMLNDSVNAFVSRDRKLAKSVQKYDDVVDELFVDIKAELTELIRSDLEESNQAVDMIMIAKYFERIGDHAVNIAEWVEFSQTGMYKGTNIM